MLPTAKSSALKAVRPYRCLLGCNLSPALRSYVNSCLRRLKTIDRSVDTTVVDGKGTRTVTTTGPNGQTVTRDASFNQTTFTVPVSSPSN